MGLKYTPGCTREHQAGSLDDRAAFVFPLAHTCPDMGSACLLGPLYHSWKYWVSSDVDAHFLSSRMQGLFYGVVAKLCRRPGTLDIQCEPSITGEQLTMGGVNLHA